MVCCLSVPTLCLRDLEKMVLLSVIRRNRIEWSLIRPVILWTIVRLSVRQDVLLPIPLPHLEPIQQCVCDGAHCSITRDFKVQRRDGNEKIAWKVNLRSLVFIVMFPTLLLCQMYSNPTGVEFLWIMSKFHKRNKISSLLVSVLQKTRNWAFSSRSRAKTAKKCTKKCDARAELLFCLL